MNKIFCAQSSCNENSLKSCAEQLNGIYVFKNFIEKIVVQQKKENT